jgi:hypothetical protein
VETAPLLARVGADPAHRATLARYHAAFGSEQRASLHQQKRYTVLLVRGLFGAWIPGHFRAPLRHLRALGWEAQIARTHPAGTLERNGRELQRQVQQLVAQGRRPVFLAHSKGGLEVMLALLAQPELAAATGGFVGVQMPRAGAAWLESVFAGAHHDSRGSCDRWREARDGAVLSVLGARAACAELNGRHVGAIAQRIDAQRLPFPWLTLASHAARATRTLELQHARLDRIAPGAPHDGVFYTADQLWPGRRNLLLADIDHAQPSVGGLGFAHDRFWAALLALCLEDAA